MEKFDLISSIPYFLFGLYLVFLLIQLSLTIERKESDTIKKFAVGKRNYSVQILLLTILGTMIGPGFSYGAIEQFYQYGIGYTGCFLFVIVQFLLFGKFFAGKLQDISAKNPDIVTIGGIIGLKYNKWAQFCVGLASVVFAIGLVATLSYAGGEVLAGFLGMNRMIATFFVIMFIMIYSYSGGIATVVKTDRINIILIGLFLLIGLGAGIILFVDNDVTLMKAFREFGVSTTLNNTPSDGWFNVAIPLLFGEIFIPVYSVRSMMTDNPQKTQKAFRLAAVVGAGWFILLTVIAIFAHLLPESVEDSGKLVYLRLIDYVITPDWGIWGAIVKSIAIIGMLGVVVSTLDSILNAAGVSFRKDIMEVCRKNPNENIHRWAIIAITVIGFICTVFATGIVDTLLVAYSLWVPAVFCPIAYCLYAKEIKNKRTGVCGIIAGFAGWAISAWWHIGIPILQGIIVSAIAMIISECCKKESTK